MLVLHESPRPNLKLLWHLRNIAIVGQSATIAFAYFWLKLPLPLLPLCLIVALFAALNLAAWLRLKSARPVSETEFCLQILLDMLGLAGLLYFTGGASNPFTSLFILQVIIAAIALPLGYCRFITFTAIALYTLLMIYKVDLPMLSHHHDSNFFSLHVQGMWVNFLLLALLVAWFVTRMAATLRRQDMLLAEAEQLASLGTFATQTAHDLGTPLATMALLAEAYRDEASSDAGSRRARMLMEQIQRCKDSISHIAAAAGAVRATSGAPMPLEAYLHSLGEHFRKDRPEAELNVELTGPQPSPIINAGAALENALLNVLVNAADAAARRIIFTAGWNREQLTLSIEDDGCGMPQEIIDALGVPGISTKPQGFGMGLYLTRAVVMRLNGTLSAQRLAGGGTCLRIRLPLSRLRP